MRQPYKKRFTEAEPFVFSAEEGYQSHTRVFFQKPFSHPVVVTKKSEGVYITRITINGPDFWAQLIRGTVDRTIDIRHRTLGSSLPDAVSNKVTATYKWATTAMKATTWPEIVDKAIGKLKDVVVGKVIPLQPTAIPYRVKLDAPISNKGPVAMKVTANGSDVLTKGDDWARFWEINCAKTYTIELRWEEA